MEGFGNRKTHFVVVRATREFRETRELRETREHE